MIAYIYGHMYIYIYICVCGTCITCYCMYIICILSFAASTGAVHQIKMFSSSKIPLQGMIWGDTILGTSQIPSGKLT